MVDWISQTRFASQELTSQSSLRQVVPDVDWNNHAFVGHFITHLFMHLFLVILGNLCTQELMSHFGYSMGYFTRKCCIILGRAWAGSKLRSGCPHVVDHTCWHVAICPAGLLWLHWHGVSFTVKPWATRGYVWAVMPGTYLEQTSPPYLLLSVTCSVPCHTIIHSFIRK